MNFKNSKPILWIFISKDFSASLAVPGNPIS